MLTPAIVKRIFCWRAPECANSNSQNSRFGHFWASGPPVALLSNWGPPKIDFLAGPQKVPILIARMAGLGTFGPLGVQGPF